MWIILFLGIASCGEAPTYVTSDDTEVTCLPGAFCPPSREVRDNLRRFARTCHRGMQHRSDFRVSFVRMATVNGEMVGGWYDESQVLAAVVSLDECLHATALIHEFLHHVEWQRNEVSVPAHSSTVWECEQRLKDAMVAEYCAA